MNSRSRTRGFAVRDAGLVSTGMSPNTNVIWEFDFTRLPLSTGTNAHVHRALLTQGRLTFSRASSATVQTSATDVVTSGIGVDDPRIGDIGYGKGFVHEGARTGYGRASEDFAGVPWGSPSWVTTNTGIAPNGTTTADRYTTSVAGNNFVAQGITPTLASAYTLRFWAKQNNILRAKLHQYFNPPGTFGLKEDYLSQLSSGVWVPIDYTTDVMTAGLALTHYLHHEVGIESGNMELWGYDIQAGNFPTEYIPTTTADVTRSADLLFYSGDLVSRGRISIEIKFIAKCAPAEIIVGSQMVLWQAASTPFDYLFINSAGTISVVRNGGVPYTSSAMSFSRGDVIEVWIETGGGILPSRSKYRKNGGPVIDLGTGAVVTTMQTSATNYLFSGGTINHVNCWAQCVRAYAYGTRPSWAV